MQTENRYVNTKWENGGEINWESSTDICTLLCVKWIPSKIGYPSKWIPVFYSTADLLYSTQLCYIAHLSLVRWVGWRQREGGSKGRGCVCTYSNSFCCMSETNTTS